MNYFPVWKKNQFICEVSVVSEKHSTCNNFNVLSLCAAMGFHIYFTKSCFRLAKSKQETMAKP